MGHQLWVGFDDAAKMLETIDMLRRPLGSFNLERNEADPIALYLIPKPNTLAGAYR